MGWKFAANIDQISRTFNICWIFSKIPAIADMASSWRGRWFNCVPVPPPYLHISPGKFWGVRSDAQRLKIAITEALFARYWLIFCNIGVNTNCMHLMCRSLSQEVINLSSVQLSGYCPTWCLIRKIQELDTSRLLDKIPVGKLELNFVKSWITLDKKVFSPSPEKCNIWRKAWHEDNFHILQKSLNIKKALARIGRIISYSVKDFWLRFKKV